MIQDTSFIIDLLRGEKRAVQLLEIIEKESRPQKVSAVTVLELYEGVARSQLAESTRQPVIEILETKHIVAANHEIMRKAGKISGDPINRGAQIDREDCIIAATALLTDEPVITGNSKHFERVDGLSVRSY